MKWLAVLIVLGIMPGCDHGADATNGPEVYAAMCINCHGPNGKPPAAMIAQLNVRDLTAPEFRARVTPALVEAQVRNGSQNKLMPSFTDRLTELQIKAVAAWIASPTFPAPPPAR